MKIRILITGLLFTACVANAQQQPPPPGQQGPPSPEERLKRVTTRLEKDLSLKPDQKQKVQDAYKAFFAGMEKLHGSNPPPPPPPLPANREEMDKLVKARDESVKKALTNDQFKKYQDIEKTMGPGRRGPGGPPGDRQGPPPQSPPRGQ